MIYNNETTEDLTKKIHDILEDKEGLIQNPNTSCYTIYIELFGTAARPVYDVDMHTVNISIENISIDK